jgi:hypothetical protein
MSVEVRILGPGGEDEESDTVVFTFPLAQRQES